MSDINATHLGPRWYVAHTYSGYENKVKANLEKIIENRGLSHLFFDIVIPVETIVEQDGDTEKTIENKVFPSYVLIKMIMSDESWHVVRNIRGVTGFVGPGSHPTPLTEEEVAALNVETTSVQLAFGIGDMVVINKGIFAGYKGRVEEISDDKKTVTVLVATGRRETPVYVDISDVKADRSAN
ncbi:MAG: transcription termination/antitermination factor NusG [Clostridia bacterium]|nr:transcription termination/antitermination factor NusG [Clostridia bacterium]MBR6742131.1 transcription termination/antitermination factor NusG [Clostridia bacterium]